MTTPDPVVAEIRKLRGKTSRLKLDLHDLAEDLPTNWQGIPEVARQTYEAYRRLDEVERLLAERDGK